VSSQKSPELLGRVALTLELDHHRAEDFVVLVDDHRRLRFQLDVLGAKQLHVGLPVAGEHLVSLRGERQSVGRGHKLFLQIEVDRLVCRLDHFDEVHVRLFQFLALGVARLFDVPASAVLIDHTRDFREIQQPSIQFRRRTDGAIKQRLQNGNDRVPLRHVHRLRNETTGVGFGDHRRSIVPEKNRACHRWARCWSNPHTPAAIASSAVRQR
jgi:hypothetical protein